MDPTNNNVVNPGGNAGAGQTPTAQPGMQAPIQAAPAAQMALQPIQSGLGAQAMQTNVQPAQTGSRVTQQTQAAQSVANPTVAGQNVNPATQAAGQNMGSASGMNMGATSGMNMRAAPGMNMGSTSGAPVPGVNPALGMPGASVNPVPGMPGAPTMPMNQMFQTQGTAPGVLAESVPIAVPEGPKAPDPVEEELKAPLKAAQPVPGSIGSAVSVPPAEGMPQSVAFNDPAMEGNNTMATNPAMNNGKKPGLLDQLALKTRMTKNTLILFSVVAGLIVILLIVVLVMVATGAL